MAGDESQEKTEQATDKRLKEVREKGQLSRSQDFTAWVGIGTAGAMLPGTIQRGAGAATDQLFTIRSIAAHPEPEAALRALGDAMGSLAGTIGPLLGAVLLAVIACAALQGGIKFKKFKGKFEQFDPVKGLKNTFGTQALWNGAKALLKTAVVSIVLYTVIQGMTPTLMTAGGLPVNEVLAAGTSGVATLLQYAVAAGLILAFADVFVVSKRNKKKTRMTKKEVKDENKSTDGDPLIKSQRRARQMAMSRNRMMSAVADADVVIVNPTHLALAIHYQPGRFAPKVVAKGSGEIATKIRERAVEAGVPIIKDIPLARALHPVAELDREVPLEFYGPIAALLVFVMALKKRGSISGVQAPNNSQATFWDG